MSDKELTQREQELIDEARAKLLAADILEEGFFDDLMAGIKDFFTNPDSILALVTGADLGQLNIGDEDAQRAFAEKAAFLPRQTSELKTAAKVALKIISDGTDFSEAQSTQVNKFFKDAVENSAKKISDVQTEEIKEITSAITKRIKDDKAAKLFTGVIVSAALLGALKTNLQ